MTDEKLYNAPQGIKVIPEVLIMIQYYWARGETINEAWKNLSGHAGKTKRQMESESHVIYSCFNYIADNEDDSIFTYINECGSICYHQDYPPHVIHQKKKK